MKLFLAALFVGLMFTVCTYAQTPVLPDTPAPVAVVVPSQVPTVAIAEPAAPPKWVVDTIVSASKLPLVGPYIAKAALYAGIIVSILTTIVTALLTILNLIMVVVSYTPLAGLVVTLQNFKEGKFMYYLKFFSMFNATHPDDLALLKAAKPVPT